VSSVTDHRHQLLHPITEFVTWELERVRAELEKVLANPDLAPYTRPRKEIQADLEAVIAEQADRERIEREARSRARQADAES
jgi:hypothetical protein